MSLAITVGLPLSGKSTLAKKMKQYGYTVICPDTIRLALHGKQFDQASEPEVWKITKTAVKALLMSGHDVIVDATNTTRRRRRMWVDMADEFNLKLLIYHVDTPYRECIKRNNDINRLDQSIINRMKDQFEIPTEDEGILMEYF